MRLAEALALLGGVLIVVAWVVDGVPRGDWAAVFWLGVGLGLIGQLGQWIVARRHRTER
jgi:hypothetical protein